MTLKDKLSGLTQYIIDDIIYVRMDDLFDIFSIKKPRIKMSDEEKKEYHKIKSSEYYYNNRKECIRKQLERQKGEKYKEYQRVYKREKYRKTHRKETFQEYVEKLMGGL